MSNSMPNRSSIVKHYSYPLKHVVRYPTVTVVPGKTMTIAAGMECSDGIILATDLEISHGTSKYLGGKGTFVTLDTGNAVAICGAGIYDVLAYACVEMTDNLHATDMSNILKHLRKTLKEIYSTHIHPSYEEYDRYATLQLLVAIVSEGQRKLYSSNRSVLRRIGPYAFHGYGEELGRYLAKKWWPKELPSCQEAIILARRIIDEVGDNVPNVGRIANIIRLDLSGNGQYENQ